MSMNLYCFATAKLYNAEGKVVKKDFIEIPLIQLPTEITLSILDNPEEGYINWVRNHKSNFHKKHLSHLKSKLKKLRNDGYTINWEVG